MSFILDALKKSENERQRQVGPSLADVPVSKPEEDKPWWAVAVAALLVINLGVLLVVLARDDEDSATSSASAPTTPVAPATSALPQATTRSTPQTAPINPAVHPLADEAGGGAGPAVDPSIASHPDLASAANVPAGPPAVRPVEPPAVAPLPAAATFQASPATNAEVLPTPIDLAGSGTNLPDLHLDIHVYSNNAPERFVLVNMRRYTEGQTLNEGPMVERITADGVVLNHRGLRFLLPRQ